MTKAIELSQLGSNLGVNGGNVGIGTASPSSLLHLSSNAPYITFEDEDNNQDWRLQATAWFALRNQTTDSELLRVDHNGGVGIGWAGTANQNLQINDSSTPKIRFSRDTSYYWDIGHTSSDFQFESETGGVIMHMNFNGNVGIGTNNPAAKLHVQGTSKQIAGAFGANVTYGGRSIQANHDIQATSMRGGVLVRNMNDYRSETESASFMHYDAYTTTAKSYAFRAARGATLSDTFWVKSDGSTYVGDKLGVASPAPLYALDVRGESMSGLEYKAICSENGVLAREAAGFGQASDNSSGCGLECILFGNNIHNNWVAFDLMIHASSCATTGASHSSAWFFYRCRVYANVGFSFTQVDAGGDTGSITIGINDDGNVGTTLGLTSNHARQFEVRMSRSGGQRSTLSVFVNSYPKIARFRRQP